jgi:hypothetical protein
VKIYACLDITYGKKHNWSGSIRRVSHARDASPVDAIDPNTHTPIKPQLLREGKTGALKQFRPQFGTLDIYVYGLLIPEERGAKNRPKKLDSSMQTTGANKYSRECAYFSACYQWRPTPF